VEQIPRHPRPTNSSRPTRRPAPTPEPPEKSTPRAVVTVRRLFKAETPEFFLLLGTTIFLLIFGLVMVLSSSSIGSRAADGDFFARAARQGMFAAIGLPVMLIASRVPATFWRKWAGWALVGALVLQLLVFSPIGVESGGNRSWIGYGSFTAQPAEFIKLALVIWLPLVLTRASAQLGDWRSALIPVAPVATVAVGSILLGGDLGSASVVVLVVLGGLFIAGTRLRHLGAVVAVVAIGAVIASTLTLSRRGRIDAWLGGCDPETVDAVSYGLYCWQSVNGWEALAHGGVFGVGLGNSAGKWAWVPAADDDFIFAIIGEELGLVGCLLVLALFIVLAVAFVRIIRLVRDPFGKIATGAVMTWIVGQAFVNIAVVLGILPVLGVPLPLVSAGGSALVTTMAAIGVVLSFARHRPEPLEDAIDVTRAGRIVR
jgi:cell division protein FtsW